MRRAYDRGHPVGAARTFIYARGRLLVDEAMDERFRRVVRTAQFQRDDGGEPVPTLRDVHILKFGAVFVLTGLEEVAEDNLARARLYAQTWQLTPEADERLAAAERLIGRLWARLHQAGIPVEMLPRGVAYIPGEKTPDGEDVPDPR